MQFNAVVANNTHALHLYERIGFTRLGVIPQGFRMPDDIMDKYKELVFSLLIFIFFEHSEYKRWKINENSKNSWGDIYDQQSENSLSIHMCSRTKNRIYQRKSYADHYYGSGSIIWRSDIVPENLSKLYES